MSQACTGLAHLISNDLSGRKTSRLISHYLQAAQDKFTEPYADYLVYLGCTHYGYRQAIFDSALKKLNISADTVNPNSAAARYIFDLVCNHANEDNSGNYSVKFITRYPISGREINIISAYLSSVSPKTVKALHEFIVIPNLF